jgi:hypothetical protein
MLNVVMLSVVMLNVEAQKPGYNTNRAWSMREVGGGGRGRRQAGGLR